MNGKGSDRRPAQVSDKQVTDNWRLVFGRVNNLDKKPEGSQTPAQNGTTKP